MRLFLNPHVRRDAGYRGPFTRDEYEDVRRFYVDEGRFPPTALRRLTTLAKDLGIGTVLAKDESTRFGVNAFKILGVRYAVGRLDLDGTRGGLVCATTGNHGRAVARAARDAGLACTVFVPKLRTGEAIERDTRAARVRAMQEDGARVVDVDGTYEDAVARASAFGETTGATIVSDTSWPGYEEVPRLIMLGYTQLFEEASRQWEAPPHVVFVQAGVGGLLFAAAAWLAWRFGPARPLLIACEPENAACLLESAQAGRPVTTTSNLDTIMAGLRCAEPSPAAWPTVAAGVDAFMTVADEVVQETLRTLAVADTPERIAGGPSGMCSLAALRSLVARADFFNTFGLPVPAHALRALAVVTEGA